MFTSSQMIAAQAVTLILSLINPLFDGIANKRMHDNAIRLTAYVLNGAVTVTLGIMSGVVSPDNALGLFIDTMVGGTVSVGTYHIITGTPGPGRKDAAIAAAAGARRFGLFRGAPPPTPQDAPVTPAETPAPG